MYSIYRVGTDGSRLQKLSDFPMQELIVLTRSIFGLFTTGNMILFINSRKKRRKMTGIFIP
ncbi:hypothetical protein AALA79_18685 [Lachnospiraceae bacterium 64-25]